MKNVFIMGDSYSTYKGYIPQGYHAYYGDDRQDDPVVRGVDKTWWRIFESENDIKIVLNDSFSGSTVCNTVRETLSVDSSFVSRIDKYINEGFFAQNDIDTMIVFGGTNDSWINSPIGTLKYGEWTADDLKYVLPAFCYLINKAKNVVGRLLIILNTGLKDEITDGFAAACENYGVAYLRLENIDKQKGHPTELGMRQIAEQVAGALK